MKHEEQKHAEKIKDVLLQIAKSGGKKPTVYGKRVIGGYTEKELAIAFEAFATPPDRSHLMN